MKKVQKNMRIFQKLKSQLKEFDNIARHSKDGNLWNIEAIVRKKIKSLKNLDSRHINDFDLVFNGYLELLDSISIRILNHYNKKNNSNYSFEQIVQTDKKGYISSGIISVLITAHIPSMVANEFSKYFAENPKDEFEAARKIKRKIILHLGETNTGKTYNALERLKQAKTGVYLAPLRILALENFEKLNRDGVPCNLSTGEEEIIVDGANHISCTIEKLENSKSYDVAVIDEIQMISDSQRGYAWTRALLSLICEEIHICGAINAKELIIKIIKDCGDDYEVIEYKRDIPLVVEQQPFNINKPITGDALIAFSKKRVLQLSKYFQDKGINNSIIYGDLPPEVRKMQYQAFIEGTNKILVTTDAIGMGVNLPIRRIVFMDLKKFDGEEVRYLTSQEVKQIAGRAGRKNIYDVGYVATDSLDWQFLQSCLDTEDEPASQAIIGPEEAIIKISGLPLKEKLALWSTRPETLNYYRKMDIRDFLIVLDSIKYYKLPEYIQFKLMKLPFDVNDNELLLYFLQLVEEHFVKNKTTVSKPEIPDNFLPDLERYYQMLNLYYSFSKNFGCNFSPEWVYNERNKVSLKINKLLIRL